MLSRRVRGFLGVMTTWGVVFSGLSVASITAMILSGRIPDQIGFWIVPVVAVRGFLTGALSGALFAALLRGRRGSQTVSTISIRRVAVLGFVGGASLPVLTMLASAGIGYLPLAAVLASTVISGVIGSGVAASIIWIAKRAPRLPSEHATPELPSG